MYFAKMACISGGRRLGLPYRPVVFVRTSCGVVCRIRHWLRLELFFGIRGSTVSGALYDAGGFYNSTFLLIIGLATVGIVCSLAISAIDKKGN